MHLIRFETPDGRTLYGEPVGTDRARVLEGDPFGTLTPTGEHTDVARLLPPVQPVNIFCIGLNYRAHAQETGAAIPEHPVVFMKPTTAVIGPEDPIPLPAACAHGPEVDYEAELAVVIGRKARNLTVAQALDYVLGYTCANDVSARRWQKHGGGGQWIRGKGFDGFCPLGPALVTADAVRDPQALDVGCRLNGREMQQGNSADMIFPVAELIAFLSRDTTLLPGTLLLTGTPPGVGFARRPPVFLADGDRVEVAIGGIGRLGNPVVAAA
ncbi:fumarylacetoacetate hydrolase family protein [uncultured Thiohalocapsa sp.]|uniref:fumarylacetoacetate hydrolase family protein n=1 Tax=uncultured Thiohalocapsa sp. TaxID=768990 RepID=UPI0025FF1B46|nr:fumarylacetoacetate hydrolase family protein [uncultured Thiohalocapsa sp.]